jgi:hypothetical protein
MKIPVAMTVHLLLLATVTLPLGGCAALVGAGATAGAYEYQNKEAIDELDSAYERGELNRNDYLRQREDVGDRSLVY